MNTTMPPPQSASAPRPANVRRASVFLARASGVFCALLAGVFTAGCATEKPKYEAVLYCEAPQGGLGEGFSFEQKLPAYAQTFNISKRPMYLPQHIADVVAVRANLDTTSGTQGFTVSAIQPPFGGKSVANEPRGNVKPPAAAVKPPAAAAKPPANTAAKPSANTAAKPSAASAPGFDASFPALLVRLTPSATRHFLGDTLNISQQRRHIFLFVNGEPVGIYRTTGPVRNGEILFHHQLSDIPPERIDEALYDLARDINKSILLIQKEIDSK
jgi:hypothetical protein